MGTHNPYVTSLNELICSVGMYTQQINLKIEESSQLAHTVHKSHLKINTPAVSTYTSQVIPQNHHTEKNIHNKTCHSWLQLLPEALFFSVEYYRISANGFTSSFIRDGSISSRLKNCVLCSSVSQWQSPLFYNLLNKYAFNRS